MAQQRDLRSTIVSAVIGGTLATIICFVFFTYFGKNTLPPDASPSASLPVNGTKIPSATPIAVPTPTPAEIPNREIKAAEVTSVSIATVYKGYFDKSDKCSKTYNEYFGNNDGIGSTSSPCTIEITVGRDGKATRKVEISRWDKAAKEKKLVEKTESAAVVTPEQFDEIAQTIVANEAFREWRDGTMINVSNCKISATYPGGIRSPMSNVDERATAYLPMVEAFRKLEKRLEWKTTK